MRWSASCGIHAQEAHWELVVPGGTVVASEQRHQSAAETVILTDLLLYQQLTALLPGSQPGQRLQAHHGLVFRAKFRGLVRAARWLDSNWQPNLLRRGEATAHFQEFDSHYRIAVRGRWKSTPTARLHIYEGTSVPANSAASPSQQRRVMNWHASSTIQRVATFRAGLQFCINGSPVPRRWDSVPLSWLLHQLAASGRAAVSGVGLQPRRASAVQSIDGHWDGGWPCPGERPLGAGDNRALVAQRESRRKTKTCQNSSSRSIQAPRNKL